MRNYLTTTWVYPSPGLKYALVPLLDFTPDFNIFVVRWRDLDLNLGIDLRYGGLTVSAYPGYGIANSGHSLILDGYSSSGYILYEWLHQVDDAYNNMSDFQGVDLLSCGDGSDPLTWFPDPDQCQHDPDDDCGTEGCSDVDGFYENMLR